MLNFPPKVADRHVQHVEGVLAIELSSHVPHKLMVGDDITWSCARHLRSTDSNAGDANGAVVDLTMCCT